MTSKMEKVAEDVALTALQRATGSSESPLDPDKMIETLRARWPSERQPATNE